MRLGHRGPEGQRGAVLVEAALVFPVIILILFGIIEFGFIFKDTLTLNAMTSSGARSGAVAGNSMAPSADYQIMSAVKAGSTDINSQIQDVVIFKASSSSKTPPAGCDPSAPGFVPSGVANQCNVYTGAQLSAITSTYAAEPPNTFGCVAGSLDRQWCPSSRSVSQAIGPDYLGVYIVAHHSTLTGFFHPVTLSDIAVVRLEPQT